jgi:hypothetical protein
MVEIIPKQIEKAPFWQEVLLYISIVLLAVIILVCSILGYSYKKSLVTISDLEVALDNERTPEKIILEKEVVGWEKKINDFAVLGDKHYFVSKFFAVIEENCHPRVWFSKLNLDSLSNSFSVSGSTDNFASLGQQLIIFKNNPIFKNVTLSQVSINKSGQVEFGLNIILDPKVFK